MKQKSVMKEKGEQVKLQVFQDVVGAFSKLSKAERRRVLQSVLAFLSLEQPEQAVKAWTEPGTPVASKRYPAHTFSGQSDLSPKEFMLQKEPRTDIERVACLAYYLSHYRQTPQFKTLDISKLNTEAAQQKFSNAAQALKNTATKGLIVQAGRGQKQLSADGEQFVEALPDRSAVKNVLERMSSRRRRRIRGTKKASTKRPDKHA
ncbi:MAG: hypothetical protein ABSH21_08675 [Verrucomicrobiia bacterium]|jgi:hypothetical protein